MMKRYLSQHATAALAAILFATILASGQHEGSAGAQLPIGDWTFTALPSTAGSSGVSVYSVTTEAYKGLAITKVGLHNSSEETVNSVKLGWQLYKKEESKSENLSLDNGQSPVLGVSIAPGERRVVDFPLVKFSDIHQSIVQRGEKVAGTFSIVVSVGEVSFSGQRGATSQPAISATQQVSSALDSTFSVRCQEKQRSASLLNGEAQFLNTSFLSGGNIASQCQNQICQ